MIADRRQLLLTGAALLLGPSALVAAPAGADPRLETLEESVKGRLGVFAMRQGGQVLLSHRADERFPMCSTFKALLVGAVLARADRGQEHLDRLVRYTSADILDYAPIAKANLAKGALTVEALCAAAIHLSDNTAANLLLASVGGPAAVTRQARRLGDAVTRLDRTEPTLNTAIPGDPRDTTSPRAMAHTLRALVLGDALSSASRAHLTGWMQTSETGVTLIRAGLPAGWRAGDKSGRGGHGSINNIAVVWPPIGEPIIVTAYLTQTDAPDAAKEAVLARVGKLVAQTP